MRIIGGDLGGRKMPEPKKFNARPTTDVAKESLFNILNNDYYFDEVTVLDLFAGTGSIGIEFASRGAISVISVEKNNTHSAYIQKNIDFFQLENMMVLNTDVFKYLEQTDLSFDIIFADPPYDMENVEKLPDLVFEKKILKEDGIFILEHSKVYSFDNHIHFKKKKRYGKVHFSFFE